MIYLPQIISTRYKRTLSKQAGTTITPGLAYVTNGNDMSLLGTGTATSRNVWIADSAPAANALSADFVLARPAEILIMDTVNNTSITQRGQRANLDASSGNLNNTGTDVPTGAFEIAEPYNPSDPTNRKVLAYRVGN